jgi:hypothetical protein
MIERDGDVFAGRHDSVVRSLPNVATVRLERNPAAFRHAVEKFLRSS